MSCYTPKNLKQRLQNRGLDLRLDQVKLIYSNFLDDLEERLFADQELQLSGFGKFKIKSRKSKKGSNPKTGEAIEIPSHSVVCFVPSERLKNKAWDLEEK